MIHLDRRNQRVILTKYLHIYESGYRVHWNQCINQNGILVNNGNFTSVYSPRKGWVNTLVRRISNMSKQNRKK